jgi:hypothetical protein
MAAEWAVAAPGAAARASAARHAALKKVFILIAFYREWPRPNNNIPKIVWIAQAKLKN